MTSLRRTLALGLGLVAQVATAPHAQGVERAVFLARVGRDTIAVETGSYAPRHTESSLLFRAPFVRVVTSITRSPAGATCHHDAARGSASG